MLLSLAGKRWPSTQEVQSYSCGAQNEQHEAVGYSQTILPASAISRMHKRNLKINFATTVTMKMHSGHHGFSLGRIVLVLLA